MRSTCRLAATQETPTLTPQRRATTPSSQLPTGKVRPNYRARKKARSGQGGGATGAGHACGYTGTPPPPLAPPGPWRPYRQHFSAGMPGAGAIFGFGFCSQVGHGGAGSNGAALASAIPPASAAMLTPTAIRAAAATRLGSISVLLPDFTTVTNSPRAAGLGRIVATANGDAIVLTLRIATTLECRPNSLVAPGDGCSVAKGRLPAKRRFARSVDFRHRRSFMPLVVPYFIGQQPEP
jgi:hypothetical protein